MKNSIITEAQIVKAIKEYECGRELTYTCRELGIHKWGLLQLAEKVCRHGQPGTETAERAPEEENRKLKHIYAELALDNKMLKDVLREKF